MGVVKLDFISNYIFTDTNFNAIENYIYFRTTTDKQSCLYRDPKWLFDLKYSIHTKILRVKIKQGEIKNTTRTWHLP